MNSRTTNTQVERQLELFKKGVQKVRVTHAAVPGDGILVFEKQEALQYAGLYEKHKSNKVTAKFTPASGVATRMFKDLFAYLENGISNTGVQRFKEHVGEFPFSELLDEALKLGGIKRGIESAETKTLVKTLLLQGGLGYGNLPKGLIDFHKYPNFTRKPVDEHLIEGARYASGKNNTCILHFTVSPAHENRMRTRIDHNRGRVEADNGVVLKPEFSYQDPATDTIAVTHDFTPVKMENGDLLFRAGGHGALLSNLQQLKADTIFIKNIDNVVPENWIEDTVFFKKVLAGKLFEIQEKRDGLLRAFESGNPVEGEKVVGFLRDVYGSDRYKNAEETELKALIDRPIRVCGMVKNTGAPGGGPFWVEDERGVASLQIVEKAEIDTLDSRQNEILQKSTHFNPVDIVCSTVNHRGEYYNLNDFKNDNRFFISEKSFRGDPILALEHPGLWNGAMANWITVFVEVPSSTFNPVKTVFDLLSDVRVVT